MTRHPIGSGEAVVAHPTAVEAHLHDGETILRLVKPSTWFVWLESWPVLFFAVMLAVGYHYVQSVINVGILEQAVSAGCVAGAFLRLLSTAMQWYSRVYVLTTLRVMRISGAFHVEVTDLPLKDIRESGTLQTRCQRAVGIGSLYFSPQKRTRHPLIWQHINNPAEVLQAVNDAARRL